MVSLPPTAAAAGGCAFIDAAALRSLLPPSALIPHLRSFLPSLFSTVRALPRQSFSLDHSPSSSLLLMPSWSSHPSLPFIGVKIVTSFPHNSALRLPGVHAAYLLFGSSTGAPLAYLDSTALTLLRTFAVSTLAAALLARDDSRVLVMAGAGALAPYLIAAYRFVRPGLNRIICWLYVVVLWQMVATYLNQTEARVILYVLKTISSRNGAHGQYDDCLPGYNSLLLMKAALQFTKNSNQECYSLFNALLLYYP